MDNEIKRRQAHPSVEIELIDKEEKGEAKRVIYVPVNTANTNIKDDDPAAIQQIMTGVNGNAYNEETEEEEEEEEEEESFKCYWKEWAESIWAALLVAVINLVWSMAVGSWLASATSHQIATEEVLLSTFICGTLFAVFGSQPVLIVGVSVPSLILVSSIFTTAHRLSLNSLSWMGWIFIWTAVLLAIMASVKQWTMLVAHYFTRLISLEIVQIFVGLNLVWHAGVETLHFFSVNGNGNGNSLVLSLWLVTCACLLGIVVGGARSLEFISHKFTGVIADFGPSFVVLALVALPDVHNWSELKVPRIKMPRFGYRSDGSTNLGTIVILNTVPVWAIFLALIPGAMLAALVLIDHCSTVSLILDSEQKQNKAICRRRDLLVLVVSLILCGLLGLPICYGLFPQSIRHSRICGCKTSDSDDRRKVKVGIERVISSLIASIIIGIPLLPKVDVPRTLLNRVPQPLLVGYCLQMGLLNLKDLRLKEYLNIDIFKGEEASLLTIRMYVVTQIICAATIFAVSCSRAVLIFPLLVLTAVWLMGRVFQKLEYEDHDRIMEHHHQCLESASPERESSSSSSVSSVSVKAENRTNIKKRHFSLSSSSLRGCQTILESSHAHRKRRLRSLSSSLRFLRGISSSSSGIKGVPRLPKRPRNNMTPNPQEIKEELQLDVRSNILYDDEPCLWGVCDGDGDGTVISSENGMLDNKNPYSTQIQIMNEQTKLRADVVLSMDNEETASSVVRSSSSSRTMSFNEWANDNASPQSPISPRVIVSPSPSLCPCTSTPNTSNIHAYSICAAVLT